MTQIYTFPKRKKRYNAMWAQISGIADCCTCGVIGRMSGMEEKRTGFTKADASVIKTPYKPVTTLKEYVMERLPTNPLFSGPADWLHWAVLEDLHRKATIGKHTPQLKAKAVDNHKFDFENNQYHKFWAGPGMRVSTWVLSDRNGHYMSHLTELRVNAFRDFIEKHKLGRLDISDATKGQGTNIWVGVYRPDIKKIGAALPKVITEVNNELSERWKKVAPHVKGAKTIKDGVAKKW